MYFIHVKIYGTDLDYKSIKEALGLTPCVFVKAESTEYAKEDNWSYSVSSDDLPGMEKAVCDLADRLYSKKDFLLGLSASNAKLYFVLTPYIETYQTILNLPCDIVTKLSTCGFNIVVDIMNV